MVRSEMNVPFPYTQQYTPSPLWQKYTIIVNHKYTKNSIKKQTK